MSRIGFVSTVQGHSWGGSEELWSQTASLMCRRGLGVGINYPWWPSPVGQVEALEQCGCSVTRRQEIGGIKGRLRRKLSPGYVYRWLDSFAPDLVVISQGGTLDGLDWMQACQTRDLPYAVVVQAANESWWPDDDQAAQFAAALEAAVSCFFVSARNLELVRVQLATGLQKAKIVRNPFNVSYDATPPWPGDDGTWKLACVGRLQPSAKGQDILFDVLRQEKWRGRPLQVTLFGDGQNKGKLVELQQMYCLESVTFGGFTQAVEQIWESHHALVLPSRYEGLPLAVVEAMLCGRPCIVTDVAGNTELVEDEVNGFVADAPTRNLLDHAMERAWVRRSEWRSMGQAAARTVRQRVPCDPIAVFADDLTRLL